MSVAMVIINACILAVLIGFLAWFNRRRNAQLATGVTSGLVPRLHNVILVLAAGAVGAYVAKVLFGVFVLSTGS